MMGTPDATRVAACASEAGGLDDIVHAPFTVLDVRSGSGVQPPARSAKHVPIRNPKTTQKESTTHHRRTS
jgi:hypothetical protein